MARRVFVTCPVHFGCVLETNEETSEATHHDSPESNHPTQRAARRRHTFVYGSAVATAVTISVVLDELIRRIH